VWSQVPVGRAHERVRAEIAPRRLALDESRCVVRGELGRLDDAHERPDRVELASGPRPAEGDARVLYGRRWRSASGTAWGAGPTSQSIRSVSARNPTVEYTPRTVTAPSHSLIRFSTSCAASSGSRSRKPRVALKHAYSAYTR